MPDLSPPDSIDPEFTQADEVDEATAELDASFWHAYTGRLAAVGFLPMLRELPRLIGQAVRLGFQASRIDLIATTTLNVASGVFSGYALYAITGVLQPLFAGGPTPARVKAALPSLAIVALATAARAGLQIAAGWAESRLEPQVERLVEVQLFDLTTRVELAAFDDG